jgi:hypothetical protein
MKGRIYIGKLDFFEQKIRIKIMILIIGNLVIIILLFWFRF